MLVQVNREDEFNRSDAKQSEAHKSRQNFHITVY